MKKQLKQKEEVYTHLRVKKETWRKLRLLQEEPSDTFDKLINRLMEKAR